jgi:hypothetical protein
MRVSVLALIATVAGCGGDTQSSSDTTDSVAAAQRADTQPTAAPATSMIGRLPLLASVLPGGKCAITPFGSMSVIKREIVYEVDYPVRVIKVALGDTSRAFAPISFEASIRREIGTDDETESIQAFFDAGGNLQSGNRRYISSGSRPANDRQELASSDAGAVKQIAVQVMEQCREPTSS